VKASAHAIAHRSESLHSLEKSMTDFDELRAAAQAVADAARAET